MRRASNLAINVLVRLGEATNHTFTLPLVIFYPTSRCNSRCVSCDWWKSTGEDDLTLEEIEPVARALPALGTRIVAFTGGEPLFRVDVFDIAALFRTQHVALQMMTSGLLLERYARQVAEHFSRVTISLDAGTEAGYHAVRGVAGLSAVEAGVARLKALAPRLPITARATLHRTNYHELPRLIDKAKSMGLDGISFLAADVSSTAFGRSRPPHASNLLLSHEQITEFQSVVDHTIQHHRQDFLSGFVAESPEKLRRLPIYYAAMLDEARFPPVACHAPWISVVIEANGAVRPCFFHRAIGNVREKPLAVLLRDDLTAFRRGFDVSANSVCERCVCSLKVGLGDCRWL